MGTPSGQSYAALIEALRAAPERFEFIQAVRLLERAARVALHDPRSPAAAAVGFDHEPRSEPVQLRAAVELAFPAAEIASLSETDGRAELSVTFMGLNGVSGVLPMFYSQLVLEGLRNRNTAPRDFFDMFNHRALSFFVRAAQKYRLPLEYEGAGVNDLDAISCALFALIGMREPSLRQRQAVLDEALLFYGGHFAHRPRTANALGQLLADHFEGRVEIVQFQGRWVSLPASEQTQLGGRAPNSGCYATLGSTAVVGARVWDVQGAFRVRVGPLDYAEFLSFMPYGAQMAELAALTRSYVGPTLSFDVQLTLKGAEVPPLTLSADPEAGPRLGWNTWLPTTLPRVAVSDPVFAARLS